MTDKFKGYAIVNKGVPELYLDYYGQYGAIGDAIIFHDEESAKEYIKDLHGELWVTQEVKINTK